MQHPTTGTRPEVEAGPQPAWWRGHALFLAVLALGVAVRVVVMVGYRPALLFPDGYFYLNHANPLTFSSVRPIGYSLFLKPFLWVPYPKELVPTAQHLLGLALAVACYAFLLRRGLPRWGAALATLPVLLDPLQLVLEHYLLADVLFEVVLVAACLVLLWRPRPALWQVAAAGFLVGLAGTVRGAGDFLLAVFLVAVVCLRVDWRKLVAFLLAGFVPLAAYAIGFHAEFGQYAVTTSGPRFLYARLAPIVSCKDPSLGLPSYEKPLCPSGQPGKRPSSDVYMWGNHEAAQYHLVPPPGMTEVQVIKDYDKRVVRAEPLALTRASLYDLVLGFSPSRTTDVPGFPSSYWLFDDHYWSLDRFVSVGVVKPAATVGTTSDPGAARLMTTYRQWLWTPGPLMAGLLVVAAAALLGVGRSRRSGDRVAVGLLLGSCVVPLLTAAAVSGFSWRYQLPQLPLLPMAGALGIAALRRGKAPGRAEPAPPLRVLDRAAGRVAGLPVPAGWRPVLRAAAMRGRLQVALAVLAGLACVCLFVPAAVASGWFRAVPAAVFGILFGVLVGGTLLVSRRGGSGSAAPPGPGGEAETEPDRPRVPTASGR